MSPSTETALAILGGEPAFAQPQHVGRPNIGDRARFMERVEDVLDRRWLTNDGPYVKAFEKRVAEIAGARHCVAVCNGTVALEIMARATGMRGEVIVPSFTFVATAHALQWQEVRPVFVDVDPHTYCLDPTKVEEQITPNTTGIIGVHLWGRPCDHDALQRIADKHGLVLAYDAAHAFGCQFNGKASGAFGEAAAFSFHATKICNALEGGAVVTDDDELAEKMRLMRNFGFSGKDNVIYLGSNGKMNEVSAAMGLTSIDSLEEFIQHNRANHEIYRAGVAELDGVTLFEPHQGDESNHQNIVLVIDEEQAGLSRDLIVEALEAENVLARRYFTPGVHGMEPYRSTQPLAELALPVTKVLCEKVLSLPTGEAFSQDSASLVCERLRDILSARREILEAVSNRPALVHE